MTESVYVQKIFGKNAVGGLEWRALSVAEKTSAQVKAALSVHRSKFGAQIEAPSGQAFVGVLPQTAPRAAIGSYAAAAWLCEARPESATIYIEALQSNMYWVVAVKLGTIDERTDKVLAEDECIPLLDALLNENLSEETKFQVFFKGRHPYTVLLERARPQEVELATLLNERPPVSAHRVRQLVGITPAAVLSAVALAVIAVASYAGMRYWEALEEQRRFEEMQRIAMEQQQMTERMANMTELRIVQAVQQAAEQDTRTPAPASTIKRCINMFSNIASGVGGWSVTRVECNPGNGALEAAIENRSTNGGRPIATSASVIAAAQRHGWNAIPSIDGAQGRLSVPGGEPLPAREGLKVPSMPPLGDIVTNLASRLQRTRFALDEFNFDLAQPGPRSITYLDPAMETSSDPQRFKQVPAEQAYQSGSIQLTGNNLWTLNAMTTINWPFLSVNKIEFMKEGTNVKWKMEIQYVAANS